MLKAVPHHLFTNNCTVSGDGCSGKILFDLFTETGEIHFDGKSYRVEKNGPFSGFWQLTLDGETIMSSKKPSSFYRTFEVYTKEHLLSLNAMSAFGRTMQLKGDGFDVAFTPENPFTRRTNITGNYSDFLTLCFAYWLVVLMWRRAQQSS